MPVTSTQEILDHSFEHRYGVAAINVVNDLTMEAVLAAAVEARAPVIVQTSVKTVRSIGADVLYAMWTAMTRSIDVPVSLHLDHCPDRAVISECLALGWNSVLFDGSGLAAHDNLRQTLEVVAEAQPYGAAVEAELEGIRGVEDGIGSDDESERQTLDTVIDFIQRTRIDCFAPAIGNAHGIYAAAPVLDMQRVTDIVAATSIPIALHGGTGMEPAQFADLVSRGCAKVNVSTALKVAYMNASREYLTANPTKQDPPSLFKHVRRAVIEMARSHMAMFASEGRAW